MFMFIDLDPSKKFSIPFNRRFHLKLEKKNGPAVSEVKSFKGVEGQQQRMKDDGQITTDGK